MKTLWTIISAALCILLLSCDPEQEDGSSQEEEVRALQGRLEEILEFARPVPCTDATDWSFVAYGSKACGGPQGYLAYHLSVDTVDLFTRIKDYTEDEEAFNAKWGILSDCLLVGEPLGIRCSNELPELVYP